MWKRAKKDLGTYQEAVINVKDAEGRGVSVRQLKPALDVATGTMPVAIPSALGAVPGPATLLAHFHDEKLWNMRTMSIKGSVEQRAGQWVFVASSYRPASPMDFLRGTRVSAAKYLERRGLPRPKPNYEVIHRLFDEAGTISDP
ncbi:MAG: hypothetical protein IPG17_00975 [Sandaracinaceae bacterium]|nr:hypothetical protein [Sandaracinaceae bacterium]MBK6813261.1 hypothetical protein [Sandaracinaceae bacterium]MBK7153158.1 hypothetical protein [Sandaracinaceae bacterium]MBK7773394.1 hypothetical protein [Sandaracinaceae bacterium]MBK8589132.1 hypothetical protein [Sandaracinaceae bacterium]